MRQLPQLELAALQKNGSSLGGDHAALKQDDALALWDYYARELDRNLVGDQWEGKLPMAKCALGWQKPGDVFAHTPSVSMTERCVQSIWEEWLPEAVAILETLPAAKPPAPFAPSTNTKKRWERIGMWTAQKLPLPPIPDPFPPKVPVKPPMPPLPGWGDVLLVLAVGYVAFEFLKGE